MVGPCSEWGVLSADPKKGKVMHRLAIVAFAAAIIASPSFAAEDTVVMRVKINDLDLQTSAGAQVALDRITRAAKNACTADTRGLRRVDSACQADLTSRAVQQLQAPQVLALYQAKQSKAAQG